VPKSKFQRAGFRFYLVFPSPKSGAPVPTNKKKITKSQNHKITELQNYKITKAENASELQGARLE
jgi:hypothetical protein